MIRYAVVAALLVVAQPAMPAQPEASGPETALATTEPLYLEVFVNGFAQETIIRVDQDRGALYVDAEELEAVGLRLDELPVSTGRIALRDIPGLGFNYVPLEQRLYLTVPPALLKVQLLGITRDSAVRPWSDVGVVFDYLLHAQNERVGYTSRSVRLRAPLIEGGFGRAPIYREIDSRSAYENTNTQLALGNNLRVFSPVGLFNNYGHATLQSGKSTYIRDESFWTYSALDPLVNYTVGDFIGSTLSWTRALRLGGARVARNFDIDPDLVTFPTPLLGSTAVVPTTVDLYVNGIRQFSSTTNPGPFQLTDPPALTGAGMVSIVYQDALGRELTVAQPLYVDNRMLERGLFDYAFEAGYARRSFGSKSFDYADAPAFVGSMRYGISNALTLEAHTELGEDLSNGGLGALLALGRFGVLSGALARSSGEGTGTLTSAGYQYIAPRWSIDLYDRRTRDDYRDLGSLERIPVPKRLTRGAFTLSFARTHALTLSYARQQSTQFGGSRVYSLGYSATFWNSRVSAFANAFYDRSTDDSVGGYVGMYVSVDGRTGVFANASRYGDEDTVSLGASRPADYDLGGFGWNAYVESGNDDYRRGLGRVDYRSRYGDWSMLVEHAQDRTSEYTNGSLFGAGSFAYLAGELMASRTIQDGFALVSTRGLPDVPVLRENRLLGQTNRRGYLLVSDLPSYRVSDLAIDITELPIDVNVTSDRMQANPRSRSGVLIEFPINRYHGATLVLVDEQQVPLPPGIRVTLQSGESALTGYDGHVFFPNLQASNHLTAATDEGPCKAEVAFSSAQVMQVIGPFVCVDEPAQ